MITTEIETTEEEAVVEAWIGMVVIDLVEETENIAVAVTVLNTIVVVAEIGMMMIGAIGADLLKAVPLLQDEVVVHVEAFHLAGVLHLVGAFHLAVHLVQGVGVLMTAASMGALSVLVVLHLPGRLHHLTWQEALVAHPLADRMMSKFSAALGVVMSSIVNIWSYDNVED